MHHPAQVFWLPLEKYGGLGRDEKVRLLKRLQYACSFSKSAKEVFIAHGALHSTHRLSSMIHGHAFRIITWQPPTERVSIIYHLGTHWAVLGDWALLTFTSTVDNVIFVIVINIYKMNACGYKIFVFPNIHTSNKLKYMYIQNLIRPKKQQKMYIWNW